MLNLTHEPCYLACVPRVYRVGTACVARHLRTFFLSLSLFLSMAHGSLALALCELAGARHGASAPTRPRGALAPRSGDVPPSRVSATPWPGAAPPSQPPRAPPPSRRTRPGASSAARRTRAGPPTHSSPAGARRRVGGACTACCVARRTSALGAGSFWRT